MDKLLSEAKLMAFIDHLDATQGIVLLLGDCLRVRRRADRALILTAVHIGCNIYACKLKEPVNGT